jgi:hypothetical protein
MLKTLANGDASGAYLNRKSHGGSYIPPADVQVVILSNYSPYKIYAQWDKKTQRHIISEDVLLTIVDRFVIVRLDGDDTEERRKFMEPSTWTEEEFQGELEMLGVEYRRGKDDRIETIAFLQNALQLYKSRICRGRSLEHFVEICLCDGNDIRLARMIFQKDLKRVTNPKLDQWRREAFFECGNDRKKYIPVSPEKIHKGLVELQAEIGDYHRYDKQRYLEAAITYPRQYAKYIYERELIERPEPHMTKEDVVAVCMNIGRKRHHSECTNNFRDGGRII